MNLFSGGSENEERKKVIDKIILIEACRWSKGVM